MKKKVAIVIMSVDGQVSLETGVGVVVSNIIEHYNEIILGCHLPPFVEVSLVCITPKLLEHAEGFRKEMKEKTLLSCKKNNGRFIEVDTLSSGDSWHSIYHEGDGYSQIEQWNAISKNSAYCIENSLDSYDSIIALGHDTPYAKVGGFIKDMKKCKFIWIPHILAAPLPNFVGSVQHQFELDGISKILYRNDFIGFIGKYIHECLAELYEIKDNNLCPMTNGIAEYSYQYMFDDEERNKILTEYDIPKERKLIFYSGRYNPIKGVDILLPALIQFLESSFGEKYHLVLLMPRGTLRDSFRVKVEPFLKKLEGKGTIVMDFNIKLPISVLKSNNLDTIIFSSRHESEPLTAMEAMLFSKPSVKIVYSPIKAFKYIFDNQPNTFEIADMTVDSFYKALINSAIADTSLLPRTSPPRFIETYISNLSELFRKVHIL
ncbi:glycosyltransferase [Klebsiella oxytoca]|uniref:glycosyltransferase n=2 Tax=Klebsiella oxytoca TaxID=571 RepID=UPI0022457E25|nr:glycosyltransferase [Klebsiella oxytoca]MCW9547313.1 hypothetical protein [Klebsiella oxytoca]